MNFELAVLIWIVGLGPLLDIPLTRWLKRSSHPGRRIYVYILTMASLLLCTAALWPSQQWRLLESPFGSAPRGLQFVAWALVAAMVMNTVQVALMVRRSPEQRLAVHHAYSGLGFFLPTTTAERRWFVGVALAAGIFEEILFRSFVIRFFDGLPLWGSALTSCALFGIAHLYQGWKHALGTLIMALLFTVIVAGTQTLVVAMLVHALWDFRVLMFMLPEGHPLLEAPPTASESA
ncbi:MAG TPA: CPBP family intramembrane metalloprotease [Fimbriimonadaceae bacterium]|nr:hypothetical protein [Armatimonadota bacterium]HCM73019.1 hypothetical protein [Armatimonadota bacterium]HRD30623.1 CPBP family intramembrane metalloprotease [Fimbriimonadaceae bacterium]HRE92716.1 CPBP family intramembrane metalloprotease [Fimbriimonadaceae bacterium]HRI75142.1 CPBP family intramembrane metalloprotease [Fimbriimonadaceae bacterium]